VKHDDKKFQIAKKPNLLKSTLTAKTNSLDNVLGLIASPIVNEITRRPEVVKQTDQIVNNSSKEVKIFYAGCEYGHARGFEAGYGKGIVFGLFAMLLAIGLTQKQQ
jgi:hypothetical protein